MREYDFEELMHPTVGLTALALDLREFALKQISRARFRIDNDCIKVVVLIKGERYIVKIPCSFDHGDFLMHLHANSRKEPSVYLLIKHISKFSSSTNITLEEILMEYRKENLKLGKEFLGETWFRLYSPIPFNDSYRDYFSAGWVDFEKQLQEGNIIYDPDNLNGIWAFPKEELTSMIDKSQYGTRLFVLHPTEEGRYILDGEEVIGDKFEVEKSVDLKDEEDIKANLIPVLQRVVPDNWNSVIRLLGVQGRL